MRRLVRSRADAVGLVFLALLVLGSAVLALLGYHLGLSLSAFLVGYLVGWVAVALGVAILLPFFVSVFGLARGVGWLVFDFGFDTVRGAFWFGAAFAAIQVVFRRFSGRGFWSEDRG